jgi:hypothetical protein
MPSYSRSTQRPYFYRVNVKPRSTGDTPLYVDPVNSGATKDHTNKQIYRKKMRKKNKTEKSEIKYTFLVRERNNLGL